MGSSEADADCKEEMDDSGCVEDGSPPSKQRNMEQSESLRRVQLLDLSDDVLLSILQHCDAFDLKALAFTCSRLSTLVRDRTLWCRVDARARPVGRARFRWLTGVLSENTTELLLSGYARDVQGCLGHVSRETEHGGWGDAGAGGDTQDCSAGGPSSGEASRSEPPPYPLHRQHARLHINAHQLPRMSGTPAWSEQYTTVDAGATSLGCGGPQFTVSKHALHRLAIACPALTSLALDYCNINCGKVAISDFPPTLKRLSLRGSKCYNMSTDRTYLFKIQDHLPLLEHLDVSECEWLEPASLLPLSKAPRLLSLLMRDCLKMSEFVAYASLAARYGFRRLKVLDMRGSPVGDSEVSGLGWVPELEELYLSPPSGKDPGVPSHTHCRGDPLPRHQELEEWEMNQEPYFGGESDRSPSPPSSGDDELRASEFPSTFDNDTAHQQWIEVTLRPRREGDEDLRIERVGPNPNQQNNPEQSRRLQEAYRLRDETMNPERLRNGHPEGLWTTGHEGGSQVIIINGPASRRACNSGDRIDNQVENVERRVRSDDQGASNVDLGAGGDANRPSNDIQSFRCDRHKDNNDTSSGRDDQATGVINDNQCVHHAQVADGDNSLHRYIDDKTAQRDEKVDADKQMSHKTSDGNEKSGNDRKMIDAQDENVPDDRPPPRGTLVGVYKIRIGDDSNIDGSSNKSTSNGNKANSESTSGEGKPKCDKKEDNNDTVSGIAKVDNDKITSGIINKDPDSTESESSDEDTTTAEEPQASCSKHSALESEDNNSDSTEKEIENDEEGSDVNSGMEFDSSQNSLRRRHKSRRKARSSCTKSTQTDSKSDNIAQMDTESNEPPNNEPCCSKYVTFKRKIDYGSPKDSTDSSNDNIIKSGPKFVTFKRNINDDGTKYLTLESKIDLSSLNDRRTNSGDNTLTNNDDGNKYVTFKRNIGYNNPNKNDGTKYVTFKRNIAFNSSNEGCTAGGDNSNVNNNNDGSKYVTFKRNIDYESPNKNTDGTKYVTFKRNINCNDGFNTSTDNNNLNSNNECNKYVTFKRNLDFHNPSDGRTGGGDKNNFNKNEDGTKYVTLKRKIDYDDPNDNKRPKISENNDNINNNNEERQHNSVTIRRIEPTPGPSRECTVNADENLNRNIINERLRQQTNAKYSLSVITDSIVGSTERYEPNAPEPEPSGSNDANDPNDANAPSRSRSRKRSKRSTMIMFRRVSPPEEETLVLPRRTARRRRNHVDHRIINPNEPQPNNPEPNEQPPGPNEPENVDAEPRHHILYVNVSHQLRAVYRLNRPVLAVRSRNRSIPPTFSNHIDHASLVSDAAIRRFGRAEDGDDINFVNIGPNGPVAREIGGRPDRSNLRILSATGYRHITDRSLIHLASAAPNLIRIDFTNTNVTPAGVERFKSLRPDVEVIYSKFDEN